MKAKVCHVVDREKLVQKLINECLYKGETVSEIKHNSLNESGLPREPLEARFLKAWQWQAPHTLGYLLYGQETHTDVTSDRRAADHSNSAEITYSPVLHRWRYLSPRNCSNAIASRCSTPSLSVPSSVWTERRSASAFSRDRIAVFCDSVILAVSILVFSAPTADAWAIRLTVRRESP